MSQYPIFNGSSPFAANTNQLPFNLNQNINIPSHVSPFQRNPNLSFLSFPPPSLTGSHHVFQNGPRFPSAINVMQPAGFATNLPNGNMISPLPFTLNPTLAGLTSVPPPQGTSTCIPTSYDQAQPPNLLNGASNYQSTQHFQQTPQKLNAQNMNPWSPATPNNFQNSTSGAANQFGTSPSAANSFNTFETGSHNSNTTAQNYDHNSNTICQNYGHNSNSTSQNYALNSNTTSQNYALNSNTTPQNYGLNSNTTSQNYGLNSNTTAQNYGHNSNSTLQNFGHNSNSTSQSYVSPWASNSISANFSQNSQGTPMGSKLSPSKFKQSKSPASDINPWAQPPIISTESTVDNYRLPNQLDGHYQHNKFNQRNFNNRRGGSRFYSNNNRNKGQNRNFKGEGDIKREINKSHNYSCDTCDRGFASEVEFQGHMAEHIKCNFRNCHFEAHPKIVTLHKRMQHDTGYADAINKLKNAEDIEKWRAERRRRFPTAANILKRKAEQAEKEDRGEVIENKDFGKFKRQNTGQSEQNNRSASRKKGRRDNKTKKLQLERMHALSVPVTVLDSESDTDDDSHIKLRKFCGVLAPIENATYESYKTKSLNSIEQEECEENEYIPSSKKFKSMGKSINGHSSSYRSSIECDDEEPIECAIVKTQSIVNYDNESDDDSPVEIPISKVPLNEVSKNLSAIDAAKKDDAESDDDAPVEIPISKVPLNEISNSSIAVKNKSYNDIKKEHAGNTGRNFSKTEPHRRNSNKKYEPDNLTEVRKSSLLEKLLADDIRHERNVIMQCIRHIVKKKFFGIGSNA